MEHITRNSATIKLKCKWCNKVYITYSFRKLISKYCSRKCYYNYKRTLPTEKQPHYKAKKTIDSNGYIIIRTGKKKIYEHRYIIEKQLKRKLSRNEIVHHLNGKRNDNRLKNLILLSKKEHDRIETQRCWDNNIFYL